MKGNHLMIFVGITIEIEDTIEVVIEEAVIEMVVEDLTAMNHQENEGVMIEVIFIIISHSFCI